jgi:hypothetical protein
MEYAFRGTVTRALIALAVLMSLTGLLWAQGGTGELTGLVTDASGAVVPNATAVLTNSGTGDKRTEITTAAGTYRFTALPIVGTYSLHITAKGFRGYEIADIIVSVGTVTTQNAKLEVGTTGETVTVEAGAQLVQTTESSLSDVVNNRVWQSMPLETRSQNEFIGLLAGAEPASNAMILDRGAAVNGARSGTGDFLVEGFDNNDQGLGGGGSSVGPGGANTTISPDAIQEYRVIEHIPNAEYGKAGGFVTDTVLKGGTNHWHGSLFEYNRIQALAANSWFSNAAHEQDHLVRNQFGGSVGGPILKDKSFFFFTLEAHRARSSSPVTGNTITSDFVNFVNSGAFEQFEEGTGPYAAPVADPSGAVDAVGVCLAYTGAPCPGTFSASSTLGPIFNTMQAAQNAPLCNVGAPNCQSSSLAFVGQGLFTGGLDYPINLYGTVSVSAPQVLNQMRYTAKFDQKLSSKDQLNAAFLYDNADSTTAYAGGDNVLGDTLFNHTRAQNLGVTWSHTVSPTILNQARVAYVRHTSNFPGDPSLAGFPSVVTAFDEPVVAYGNSSNLPQFFTENEFVYKDDLSVTHGKHNFKGGGEYRRTRNGSSFDALENSLFLPYSTEDLLTDLKFDDAADILLNGAPTYGSVYYAEASINPTTGELPLFYRGYRANEVAAYIQDDWRIRPRLTFNLGVRWEYFGPPHNFQANIDSDFYTGARTTPFVTTSTNPFMPVNNPFYAGIATGAAQVKNHDIWNKDLNNFGPRIGFAYDVRGTGKLVVRGGYGINYDRMYNNIFENIRFNPPYFAFSVLGAFGNGVPIGGLDTPGIYSAPFTSTAAFGGSALTASLRDVDQNLVTAYYEQANFGFQYELAKDFVLETNYVGTYGHKLLGIIGANTFDGRYAAGLDNTAVNPTYANISLRTNCCSSNYNAVQVTVRKRFSGGLQFNANYTYSKALDDISDAFATKNASLSAYPTDSTNPKFDYGSADFDVRQRLVFSYNYDLPFAKGNRWLGGWSLSGILSVQTGSPFSVTDSCGACDSNADGQLNDRAAWLGTGKITSDVNHSISPAKGYLTNAGWGMPGLIPDPATQPNLVADPCPASVNLGLWCQGSVVGQMRRNSLYGPHYANLDFGVAKAFRITENTKVTLLGNFFNLFNHPNFLNPDVNLADSTFGQSLSTFAPGPGGARVTQLALRFDF